MKEIAGKRNASIDILKSIAIFGVLIIHVSANGIIGNAIGSFNWVSSAFWGSIIRFSVPVFFMCSGALLLDPAKDIPIKKLFTKYIFRILVALFFWAFAYEVFDILRGGVFNIAVLGTALKNLVTFKHHFHFYYLHMMLLNYAFLPLTRIFTRNASKQEFKYALLLWFAVGIILPTVSQFYPFTLFSAIIPKFIINSTYASIGFGMAGYYIKKYMPSRAYIYALLFGGGFAIAFGGTIFLSLRSGTLRTIMLEGMTVGVALMAIGLFGFVSKTCQNTAPKKVFTILSAASFCIYLVHDFFNIIIIHFGITVFNFSPIWSIPIIAATVLGLSFCVYLVLSKIPIVKKYLI